MDNKQIEKILKKTKKNRELFYENYHHNLKFDPEFIYNNRAKVADHYRRNKDKKKKYYENNKKFILAKNKYLYYMKLGRLDDYKNKYPEQFEYIMEYI
jgi:hypothetical protein